MFKERLAEEIRKSGLLQHEVATRVGVSQQAVSAWLRGSEPRRPQYESLLRVLPGLREEAGDAARAS